MLTLLLSVELVVLVVDMVVVGRDIPMLLVYVDIVVVSKMRDVGG